MEPAGVPPRVLGVVERFVRALYQLFHAGHPGFRSGHARADSEGLVSFRAGHGEMGLLHVPVHALRHEERLFRRGAGEHGEELVPSIAPDEVGRADPLPEQARGLGQVPVPRHMAVPVVELLEPVQVEERHRDGGSLALEAGELRGQDLENGAAVVHGRKGVRVRLAAYPLKETGVLDGKGDLAAENLEDLEDVLVLRLPGGPAPHAEAQHAHEAFLAVDGRDPHGAHLAEAVAEELLFPGVPEAQGGPADEAFPEVGGDVLLADPNPLHLRLAPLAAAGRETGETTAPRTLEEEDAAQRKHVQHRLQHGKIEGIPVKGVGDAGEHARDGLQHGNPPLQLRLALGIAGVGERQVVASLHQDVLEAAPVREGDMERPSHGLGSILGRATHGQGVRGAQGGKQVPGAARKDTAGQRKRVPDPFCKRRGLPGETGRIQGMETDRRKEPLFAEGVRAQPLHEHPARFLVVHAEDLPFRRREGDPRRYPLQHVRVSRAGEAVQGQQPQIVEKAQEEEAFRPRPFEHLSHLGQDSACGHGMEQEGSCVEMPPRKGGDQTGTRVQGRGQGAYRIRVGSPGFRSFSFGCHGGGEDLHERLREPCVVFHKTQEFVQPVLLAEELEHGRRRHL